ncbi:MAG TPA: hypothetical protein VGQ41_00590 [Pyrinomonadaceae bacterium]|jgi:hypothetical protein|nr:hypothetical protein [Pyrinomonadaceae bacterium]
MLGKLALLALIVTWGPAAYRSDKSYRTYNQSNDLSVEVFQVLDLPLSVHEASLVKSGRGYLVKLALGNSSEVKLVGLRYSLVTIDSKSQTQPLVNRTEGFAVQPYASKTLTFKTPLRFKQKDGERLVLMVEQVISREWIWEVVKAKEALDAYARGDYSVMPAVLRVANQVDAPMTPRVIYRLRRNEE